MGAFGYNFPDFRAIWQGTTKPECSILNFHSDETETAKPIWSCRSKYLNFYGKPRLPTSMTNEDVLDRFRTFRAVKLQPVLSYRYERRHFRSDEHVIKAGKSRGSNSRRLWGGVVSFLFVSRTKTRVLRTREDLCYHCGPFPACVGIVFNHLLVWMSFSRTSEDIYG